MPGRAGPVLTAESKTVSSGDGKESRAHFRLVAVYAQEVDAVRLVHFESATLPERRLHENRKTTLRKIHRLFIP